MAANPMDWKIRKYKTVRIRIMLTQGSSVLTTVQQGAVTLPGDDSTTAWSVTTSSLVAVSPGRGLLPGRAHVSATVESFDSAGRRVHVLHVDTDITILP